VLITATPFSNNPAELWNLLHILDPLMHRSYWYFRTFYSVTDETERVVDTRYRTLLHRELGRYMIRRLKSEVEVQLPPKRYQTMPLYMHPEQVKLYREMVHLMLMELDSGTVVTAANMGARLVRLRQIVSGTSTLEHLGQQSDISAKLDAVVDIIEDRLPSPTVVFTVFRATALSLARRLSELETPVPCTCIIGGSKPATGEGSVAQAVLDFQVGKTKVFVATVRSGGEGITLTASDTVVFIDKDWNPAVQEQAENRIHRIGQTRPCLIINLHVSHTVDDIVEAALERKIGMREGVIVQEVREFLEDSLKFIQEGGGS
jgi:SNF2 family DNA or RNA helicase